MNINEIYNKKWKVSKNLQINGLRTYSISKVEQEFHINILAEGDLDHSKSEAHLCCSIPSYIDKLTNNKSFLLTSVVKSIGLEKGNDRVLQVTGIISDVKLISVKSTRIKMNLSPEERERRRQLMKKVRESKK